MGNVGTCCNDKIEPRLDKKQNKRSPNSILTSTKMVHYVEQPDDDEGDD